MSLPRRHLRHLFAIGVRFSFLAVVAIVMLFPLAWILSGSLKPLVQVFSIPVTWIPRPVEFSNYIDAWLSSNFTRNLINSAIVLAGQVTIQVTFSTLAGYGFAKHHFPGKEAVFVLVLSMSLLPLQIIMVPLFLIVKTFHWINTYQGLILPVAVNAFGVFFMRQFMETIPSDYVEAARIDGLGELGICTKIVAPMASSAITTLAVLAGLDSWNLFLWPLIVVSSQHLATMPLGIAYLRSTYEVPANWLLAVAVVMVLPPLILFAFAQKRIMESAAQTGIK